MTGSTRVEVLEAAEEAPPHSTVPPVAGLDGVCASLRELLLWPRAHAAAAAALGVRWPRGVLLHGAPGVGKSAAARAVAAEAGASVHVVTAAEVVGAFAGESERNLRERFERADAEAADRPVVLLLEDVDTLCPRREAGGGGHDARLVAQLLTLMQGEGDAGKPGAARALVIATTSRPHALDPALRRPGRLDREVEVPPPDEAARAAILAVHCRDTPLAPDADLTSVAEAARGYTGADLASVAREAAMAAVREVAAAAGAQEGEGEGAVTAAHFAAALCAVRPSATRGLGVAAAAEKANGAAYGAIGGLEGAKAALRRCVELPLRRPEALARLGARAQRGAVLYGPPGSGKTTLARAAAAEAGVPLVPLSGADLFSMYVGEGERLLRRAFKRARSAAPAILFLDEADALGVHRHGHSGSGGGDAGQRLLATLLTEMDGVSGGGGVVVIAATNRPDMIDAALLRPGRLDAAVYVPPPDEDARLEVLKVHASGMALAEDVDLRFLAGMTEHFSGAELEALCREAALAALREDIDAAAVSARHFAAARAAMSPALSWGDLEQYEAFRSKRGGA